MHRLVRQLAQLLADVLEALATLPPPPGSDLVTLGGITGRWPHECHGPLAPGTRWTRARLAGVGPYGAVRCGACGLLATTPKALRLHRTPDGQCLDPATDRKPHGGLLMWDLPAADGGTIWCWPNGRSRDLLAA